MTRLDRVAVLLQEIDALCAEVSYLRDIAIPPLRVSFVALLVGDLETSGGEVGPA